MPLYSIIGLLHAVQLGQVGRPPIPRRCAAHPRSLSEATNSTPQGAYPAWGSFLWRHRDHRCGPPVFDCAAVGKLLSHSGKVEPRMSLLGKAAVAMWWKVGPEQRSEF